ncbi:MAG: hypothetical protein ACR5LD_01525 [Symbiopectobacterium sp.]
MVKEGVTVDRFSYAILPSLAPYRYNTITLDTSTMNDETKLQGGFDADQFFHLARQGRAVLIATQLKDGVLPLMGADVVMAAGNKRWNNGLWHGENLCLSCQRPRYLTGGYGATSRLGSNA